MQLRLILSIVVLFLSGCLLSGEKEGVAGTWVYHNERMFSDYPPVTETYIFSQSGEVNYGYRWGNALSDSFSGTWALRTDSLLVDRNLLINRQNCLAVDSIGSSSLQTCSVPLPREKWVYWDGDRIYVLNDDHMRRYFDRK